MQYLKFLDEQPPPQTSPIKLNTELSRLRLQYVSLTIIFQVRHQTLILFVQLYFIGRHNYCIPPSFR